MKTKLPDCYYCGKSVARKGRFLFTIQGKIFAWHTGRCAKKSPSFRVACKVFARKITEDEGLKMLEKKEAKKKEKEVVAPIEGHVYVEPEKKVFDKEEREVSDKISKDIEKESKELEKGLKNIEEKEKKSFFKSIFSGKKFISSEDFQEYSEDLEMILLENNVALEVAEKIILELKEKVINKELLRGEIEGEIRDNLREIITGILIEPFDIIQKIKEKSVFDLW